jgi:hypothetical protein
MIQSIKNHYGARNFNHNLPKIHLDNNKDYTTDQLAALDDLTDRKNFIDYVMITFRKKEQMEEDIRREEGLVAGTVRFYKNKRCFRSISGNLKYNPKTEKPVEFDAAYTHLGFGKMSYRDDGNTITYSYTDQRTRTKSNGMKYEITGTESLKLNSKSGELIDIQEFPD